MKTILITGANSEIANTYISENGSSYDCIIAHHGHRKDRIDELVKTYGNKLVEIKADLSKPNEVEELAKTIQAYEIDEFLHLAAPKLRHVKFTKSDMKSFELEMQVVYWSFLRLCQIILPNMIKRQCGRILAILTEYTVSHQPAYLSHYIAAKFALLGLIKSLSSEFAEKSIKINAISPGMIETDFVSQLPQYVIENNAKATLNKKNLHPIDLIPTIKYLLSEASGSINGQNILLQ